MIKFLVLAFGFALVFLFSLRAWDELQDQNEQQRLQDLRVLHPPVYDPNTVKHLPGPAQKYFQFSIQPGTPLHSVAEIEMTGDFSLGSKNAPNYQPMNAHQVLAAPHGFIWKVNLPGLVAISGSDTGSWTRFRILGLIPVARQGGTEDHRRAAFGRYVAEAVFWTPAALLPSETVRWESVDEKTARAIFQYQGITQAVDIEVDPIGKPVLVKFMRWSNANPEKTFRLQPFGGYLSDFRTVQGFQVPFYVEAGNQFGTEDYFPFFKAKLNRIRW